MFPKARMTASQIDPSKRWAHEAVWVLHEGAEDALVHLFNMR